MRRMVYLGSSLRMNLEIVNQTGQKPILKRRVVVAPARTLTICAGDRFHQKAGNHRVVWTIRQANHSDRLAARQVKGLRAIGGLQPPPLRSLDLASRQIRDAREGNRQSIAADRSLASLRPFKAP